MNTILQFLLIDEHQTDEHKFLRPRKQESKRRETTFFGTAKIANRIDAHVHFRNLKTLKKTLSPHVETRERAIIKQQYVHVAAMLRWCKLSKRIDNLLTP